MSFGLYTVSPSSSAFTKPNADNSFKYTSICGTPTCKTVFNASSATYAFAIGGVPVLKRCALEAYFNSGTPRSEEHTSELQSRGHLVCRLLLEKKNNERSHISD